MKLFKRSNGFYYIKIFDEFGNEIKRISTREKRKSAALKKLSQLKSEFQNEHKIKHSSFKSFRENYIKYINQTKSAGYQNSVRSAFNFFSTFIPDDKRLIDVDPNVVEIKLLELSSKSPYSADTFLRIAKAAFQRAVTLDLLNTNKLRNLSVPKPPEKENIFINPDEFNQILDMEKSQLLKDIYVFAYNTGMRISEVINTRLSWIDEKEKVIVVQNSDSFRTKSKKNRAIPINQKLFEIINRNKPKVISISQQDYLFRKKGVRVNPEYVSKQFKKVARLVFGKDTRVHLHNLRGSFGSELIKKGVNPVYVQKLLGHSSFSVTERNYLSIQLNELRKAVDKL